MSFFGLSFYLLQYSVYASSEGSDETVQMLSLRCSHMQYITNSHVLVNLVISMLSVITSGQCID